VLIFLAALITVSYIELDAYYRWQDGKRDLDLIVRVFHCITVYHRALREEQLDWLRIMPWDPWTFLISKDADERTDEDVPFPWPELLPKVRCTVVEWHATVGLDDAMLTALASGALWAWLGIMYAEISRWIRVEAEQPRIFVTPLFQSGIKSTKTHFSCDLLCIFDARLGHIIFVGVYWLKKRIIGKRR
jgi:hypothetical protein